MGISVFIPLLMTVDALCGTRMESERIQPGCWGRGAWCLEERGSQVWSVQATLAWVPVDVVGWTELEKMRVVLYVGVIDGARGSCWRGGSKTDESL